MKSFIIFIVLALPCSLLAKSTWECRSQYHAGIGQDAKMQVSYNSGKDTSGHTHIFSGIGTDVVNLSFKEDKSPPDKLIHLAHNNYIFFNEDATVLWKFYEDKMVAIKMLTYKAPNGPIVSNTGWFSCK